VYAIMMSIFLLESNAVMMLEDIVLNLLEI